MKKPVLLFAIKCSVILYFAACTSIDEYTTADSATPRVTQGTWKVNLFIEAENDNTKVFDGYTLTFQPSGKIIAAKNTEEITGNWSEDNIQNRITINLDTKDPALAKLNKYWNISNISNAGLSFQNAENPSSGWLQITSL
ncbi:MAG: hypothetical protein IPL84_06835 [Chitinophagaceae bacterium]|nr:hypothetical protein [Chitinophagaceae bacterium]